MGKILKAWRRLAHEWGGVLIVGCAVGFVGLSWSGWGGWAIAISNVLAIFSIVTGMFIGEYEGRDAMIDEVWLESSDTHQEEIDSFIGQHYNRGYNDATYNNGYKPHES